MAVDKDINEIVNELTNFLTASIKAYAGSSTTDYFFDLATFFQQGRTFTGQAHGGYYVQSFSASLAFNGNNGNNQVVTATGDTTITTSNLLPGVYTEKVIISGGGVSSITLSGFGTAYTYNDDLAYTDGSINIITLHVDGNNNAFYTITAVEA